MSIFESSPWSGRMLSVLRVAAAIVFVSEGAMKLFGYPPSATPLPPIQPGSQLWFAGTLEFFGGLAMLVGLCTRPIAFLLSGEMAVAYFQVHFPQSVFPTVNQGIPAILFCFIFLYMSFAGAGQWSVDAMIARMRRRAPTTSQANRGAMSPAGGLSRS